MLTRFRSNVNRIIIKVAGVCQKLGMSPNSITLLGLILSVLALPFAIFKNYILLLFIIIVSSFMDVLDGALARLSKRITAFGGVLDSICDRIEEFFFLTSLHFTGISVFLIFIVFTISYTISYLRALGEVRGVKLEGIGLLERSERIMLIIIAVLLLSIFNGAPITILYISIYEIPMLILVVLGIVTILQRILYLYHSLKMYK